MSPEMHTALWITAVGSAVLFGLIACLVGLMYMLTARWLFPKSERPAKRVRRRKRHRRFRRRATDVELRPAVEPDTSTDDAERDRRRRAVALAVAIACAESSQVLFVTEAPSDWRLLHRANRLSGPPLRRKARS